jgi:hypothetical protein
VELNEAWFIEANEIIRQLCHHPRLKNAKRGFGISFNYSFVKKIWPI